TEAGTETTTEPAIERGIDAGVAEAIVSAALVAIAQYLVRLVDLLELLGGGRFRVTVRMVVKGKLAEGAADVIFRRAPRHAENFVVVAFAGSHHLPEYWGWRRIDSTPSIRPL